MGQCSTQLPAMSAGSISSDWPMPYQLCSVPLRPWTPNSGYSLGKTGGSEVQKAWVDWRRKVVSAVPSSPDCTAKAIRPAASASKAIGLRKNLRINEILKWVMRRDVVFARAGQASFYFSRPWTLRGALRSAKVGDPNRDLRTNIGDKCGMRHLMNRDLKGSVDQG